MAQREMEATQVTETTYEVLGVNRPNADALIFYCVMGVSRAYEMD